MRTSTAKPGQRTSPKMQVYGHDRWCHAEDEAFCSPEVCTRHCARMLRLWRLSGGPWHGPTLVPACWAGCCKTRLARAAAAASGARLHALNGAQVYSAFVGEAEARLRAAFKRARAVAPAILFLDELDALVGTPVHLPAHPHSLGPSSDASSHDLAGGTCGLACACMHPCSVVSQSGARTSHRLGLSRGHMPGTAHLAVPVGVVYVPCASRCDGPVRLSVGTCTTGPLAAPTHGPSHSGGTSTKLNPICRPICHKR